MHDQRASSVQQENSLLEQAVHRVFFVTLGKLLYKVKPRVSYTALIVKQANILKNLEAVSQILNCVMTALLERHHQQAKHRVITVAYQEAEVCRASRGATCAQPAHTKVQ